MTNFCALAPRWGQSTGFTVLLYINSSAFNSWEDQALPSSHPEKLAEKRAFNNSVVVACRVTCVTANNGFLLSIIFHPAYTQMALIFITCLLQAFWCRRWQSWVSYCNQTHHWSWLCCDSFFTWFFLRSCWHHFRAICRTEMAKIEQRQQVIPLITCEIPFGSDVCELVFGVDVLDLDFGVQVDSIEQPIKSNSVVVGVLPLIIILMRKLNAWGNKVNSIQNIEHSSILPLPVIIITANNGFPPPFYHGSESCIQKTKTIKSQKSRARIQSNLNPASKEMISDFIELCGTAKCFLHIQLIGTNVWLPKTKNISPGWFDWELLDCWTTCPSGRWSTSEPISSIQSCF